MAAHWSATSRWSSTRPPVAVAMLCGDVAAASVVDQAASAGLTNNDGMASEREPHASVSMQTLRSAARRPCVRACIRTDESGQRHAAHNVGKEELRRCRHAGLQRVVARRLRLPSTHTRVACAPPITCNEVATAPGPKFVAPLVSCAVVSVADAVRSVARTTSRRAPTCGARVDIVI